MKPNWIEETIRIVKSNHPEIKKIWMKELEAMKETYMECATKLSYQSKEYESRARELDLLRKYIVLNEETKNGSDQKSE